MVYVNYMMDISIYLLLLADSFNICSSFVVHAKFMEIIGLTNAPSHLHLWTNQFPHQIEQAMTVCCAGLYRCEIVDLDIRKMCPLSLKAPLTHRYFQVLCRR